VKFVLLFLFGLGALATAARSEAVLPAYLLGLVAAGTFHEDPRLAGRIRGMAFSFLTPFFFLKAGTLIVLKAVVTGIGSIAVLFGVKVGAKIAGVHPATLAFRVPRREAWYTTMMMSTGLTFGSISALFGLTHGYIDRGQYSILVTVVVLTALVPTFIAQAVSGRASPTTSTGASPCSYTYNADISIEGAHGHVHLPPLLEGTSGRRVLSARRRPVSGRLSPQPIAAPGHR
jgi:Kef-type K+ transport system membrane component KefB